MKAVVQRVTSASVTVNGKRISEIAQGFLVLVGLGQHDTASDCDWLANKLLSLRLFPDDQGTPWKKSVVDKQYEVLCVSQFTLFATVKKGSKPDFHGAMHSATSKEMYGAFLDDLRTRYAPEKIQDGEFGAMMDVALVNDGPVTILLDSREEGSNGSGASTPSAAATAKQARKEAHEATLRDKQAKASARATDTPATIPSENSAS